MTAPGRGAVPPELYRAIVEQANELITVFDHQGTILFVNEACRRLLGFEPADVLGHSIISFVHPDERVRAEQTLHVAASFGSVPGTTHFRLRTGSGDFLSIELTSGTFADGAMPYLMTIGRPAGTRFALDAVLRRLLEDGAAREVRATVCDLFGWRAIESSIAVAWEAPDGAWDWVGTPDYPAALSGVPMVAGSPWAEAVRSGRDIVGHDLSGLDPALRDHAQRAGRGSYWILPVVDAARPSVVSAWMPAGGRPPTAHAEGMELAARLLRLIARWEGQQAALDRAANSDELTGLANRPAFFRALAGSEHGAVLYCDLDRFKPINDAHGHAGGDAVLRAVAARVRGTVRAGDTVARIGGDEFAVLCPASTRADAEGLAERIRAAVERPIPLGATEVQVGISIGIAHTTDRLDAESVAAADRALYAAKVERRTHFLGGREVPSS